MPSNRMPSTVDRRRLRMRFTWPAIGRPHRIGGRQGAGLAAAALVFSAVVPLSGAGPAQAGPAIAGPAAGSAGAAGAAGAAKKPAGDVMANLFEWNWRSVAKECKSVLGPAGYGGVQVSPPQDSLKRTKLGDGSDTVLHPWWEVYQPVDYALTSRMGSEAEFKAMVKTCRGAGVKVYVDAVINHMTGQGSVSYGGRSYEHFSYPGVYTAADFHQKGPDCTSSSGGIEDFNNLIQVRKCELVGLADLRTETARVQARLASYLNKLIGYGVSGFRVDAAKHIGQPDLAAIAARLHRTADGTRPYLALEVFGGGPGVLAPEAFTSVGSVLGLDADVQLKNAFKSYPANATGSLATLQVFGEGSGLPPSNRALTFVQNHDTERNGDALNYKDGATNTLANQFLLAYGYGTPQVYSGFAWAKADDSPPSDGQGLITDTTCDGTTWVCVDRDPAVLAMVGWHNTVAGTAVTNWWDDGQNLIAFSRGHRGWVALNNDPVAHTQSFTTGLAKGTYCDLIRGHLSHGSCSGPTVSVDRTGRVAVTVPPKGSVAISVNSLVRS
jgi:alpha-amylase